MSESIQSTLISALPAATKVSDTDIVVLENGSTTQKITIAQLKEALGINALNTKIPCKIVIKYFDKVYINNGYLETQPSDFGLNSLSYILIGHKTVPQSCIITGYYCYGKKSYASVYNSDGTPYSGFISVTVVAFGN